MKKVVLLVASVLAAIQSIANRCVEGANSNPLILSPSDGIYNHGSHASHASHTSHFSMVITTRADSVSEVRGWQIQEILSNLAKEHKVLESQIKISHFYLSNYQEVHINGINYNKTKLLDWKENCIYLDYFISGFRENSYNNHYGYIIPQSSKISIVGFINYQDRSVEKRDKTDWMNKL